MSNDHDSQHLKRTNYKNHLLNNDNQGYDDGGHKPFHERVSFGDWRRRKIMVFFWVKMACESRGKTLFKDQRE